jgi:UDP-glucose 4-epimerase
VDWYDADVRDTARIAEILSKHECDAVIHFAGLKAVGESSEKPLEYYSANVTGTHSLIQAMLEAGASQIVFSSSATVYGEPEFLPYTESHRLRPTNPYGNTKLAAEMLLNDVAGSGALTDVAILRYFNPIGAHPSGMIGEDPNDIPNNLMPYVAQVAVGRRPVSTCSAMTMTRPMGPACGITSTSWTLPVRTCWHWTGSSIRMALSP